MEVILKNAENRILELTKTINSEPEQWVKDLYMADLRRWESTLLKLHRDMEK